MPALLFLIFGLVDVGRLMLLNMTLTSAAAEGSRTAARSVTRTVSDVTRTIQASIPGSIAKLSNPACSVSDLCVGAAIKNDCAYSNLVTATARLSFQFLAPNVVAFAPFVPGINPETGTLDVSASSTALCLD